jgi:heat shock protein HslJ
MQQTLIIMLLTLGLFACNRENTEDEIENVTPADLSKTWKVERLNGKDVKKYNATITLDLRQDIANGMSSCNQFAADTRHNTANKTLKLTAFSQTKVACKDDLAFFEIDFFEQLQKITHFQLKTSQRLILIDDAGKRIELQ